MTRLTRWSLKDFNGTLNLRVVATATETANGDIHSTTATIAVTVVPVNDAPVARNASYRVQEDGSVRPKNGVCYRCIAFPIRRLLLSASPR